MDRASNVAVCAAWTVRGARCTVHGAEQRRRYVQLICQCSRLGENEYAGTSAILDLPNHVIFPVTFPDRRQP
jgi:hypothetical protein